MLDSLHPRIQNPAMSVPGTFQAITALYKAIAAVGVDPKLLELLNMRASQINGCSVCLEGHGRILRRAGETDARMDSIAGWRDSPHFSVAERAALALAEAVTRLADRPDPVPAEVWGAAAEQFAPAELAAIVLSVAQVNLFNRVNVATGQIGGSWAP